MKSVQEKLDAFAAELATSALTDGEYEDRHRRERALRTEAWAAEFEQNAVSRAACIAANESSTNESEARMQDVERAALCRDKQLEAWRSYLDRSLEIQSRGVAQVVDAIRSLKPT